MHCSPCLRGLFEFSIRHLDDLTIRWLVSYHMPDGGRLAAFLPAREASFARTAAALVDLVALSERFTWLWPALREARPRLVTELDALAATCDACDSEAPETEDGEPVDIGVLTRELAQVWDDPAVWPILVDALAVTGLGLEAGAGAPAGFHRLLLRLCERGQLASLQRLARAAGWRPSSTRVDVWIRGIVRALRSSRWESAVDPLCIRVERRDAGWNVAWDAAGVAGHASGELTVADGRCRVPLAADRSLEFAILDGDLFIRVIGAKDSPAVGAQARIWQALHSTMETLFPRGPDTLGAPLRGEILLDVQLTQ